MKKITRTRQDPARKDVPRKNTERAVESALRQKDLLLKELYHRVNNNLQIIISLLKLQAGYVNSEESRALLRRNRNRIISMAMIHEILYGSDDLNRVDFDRYLGTLVHYLFEQYSVPPGAISLETEVREIHLNINTAIPCGLILNELLAGALESPAAGPGREMIRIGIRPEIPDRVEISFSRRGNSFPGLSPEPESPSFGRELIQTLVDQLGGNLSTERGEWTTWKIDFSLSDNRIKSGGRL
jgi:two-component sensor histidine kinase